MINLKEHDVAINHNYFTSAVHSLSHWHSSPTAGTQEPLAHLPQDRVLYTWMQKSDNTNISIQLKWNAEHLQGLKNIADSQDRNFHKSEMHLHPGVPTLVAFACRAGKVKTPHIIT